MKAQYQYPDRVGGAAADEVPAGSFCGGDEIPPGTFHNVEAPRKIIEEVEKVR